MPSTIFSLVGFNIKKLARRVGFEPTTNRLTADRSTTELPPNTCPHFGQWLVYQKFV